MSSTGQVIGGIVGGVIGFFAGGNVMLGASIGMSIGGYIDPPKGPKGRPPSASDLAVQTATYGAALGDGDGTYGTLGNIFWVEGNTLRAEEHKEDGGKGGAPSGPTTYDIYGTFAIGFGEGEIAGYGRVWFGSKLIADYTSTSIEAIMQTATKGILGGKDSISVIGSSATGGTITYYLGSSAQLPDDRIQADMGAANTPAYRGLHYIVVKDWPMADFGNTLMGMQVKAEIIHSADISQPVRRVYIPDGLYVDFETEFSDYSSGKGPYNPSVSSGLFTFCKEKYTYCLDFEGNLVYRSAGGADPGVSGDPGERYFVGTLSGSAVWYDNVGPGIGGGTLKIAGSTFASRTGNTTDAFCGACIGGDGRLYVLMSTAGTGRLDIFDASLTLQSSQPQSIYSDSATTSLPGVPGTQLTFCVENNGAFLWTAQSFSTTNDLNLYAIAPDGSLDLLWNYGTSFFGTDGLNSCMAAENGICYHATDGGSLAVFDRNPVVSSELVPLADVIERRCLKSGLLSSSDIDVSEITQMLRGYRVANIGTVRSSLEPLQAAWPFDVIPDGYKIKFVPRGKSSVATIDISELGCVAGTEAPGVRITTSREMDSQLPRKVIVTYLDVNREYDLNTGPGSERLNTDAVNIEQIELPIVMTATEAAQTEEVLLYLRWLDRHDVSFVLPPAYLNLEPADVITINGNAATYEVRLQQINYLPDGRMECSAKFNNVAVYTSVAVAQEGLAAVQTLKFSGPSFASMLDVPVLDSAVMDKSGLLSAVSGYYSGWPGATLFRSDDAGQSWAGVQGFKPPGCIIGSAINTVGSVSRYSVDLGSVLNVRLISGDLSSVTQEAMFNGANHFAYGAHGRWEIIAAQNCVEQADGSWSLSNLLRGRFGTERHMATHAVDDVIVLLDQARVRFIGMDIASLNVSRLWRPVTSGLSLDTAPETALAYSGENLKPLSPVDLKGARDFSTRDWSLEWNRRTRTPVEVFSGIAMPLGETSESYEIEVWTSDWLTLKRTISVSGSATATYSYSQQVADFGFDQESIYVKLFQLSPVIGRGASLTQSILSTLDYEAMAPSFMVFGLHFNGANGSTVFTDVKGKTVTKYGNAQIVTDAAMFGGACGSLDGTGDYLRAPYSTEWAPGSGDYTVRGWINPTNVTSRRALIGTNYYVNPNYYGWILYTGSAGELGFMFRDSLFATYYFDSATGVVQNNTRAHVAWTKQGNVYRTFYNGVKVGEQTITQQVNPHGSSTLCVGRWDNDWTTDRDFAGKLDDWQILKGICLYKTNYSPPNSAFIDS